MYKFAGRSGQGIENYLINKIDRKAKFAAGLRIAIIRAAKLMDRHLTPTKGEEDMKRFETVHVAKTVGFNPRLAGLTNAQVLNNSEFQRACIAAAEKLGVEAATLFTKRQASKYIRKVGLVWETTHA